MNPEDKTSSRNKPPRDPPENSSDTMELHSSVLSLLRKITSTISRHSHQLTVSTGLTVPQLLCLRHVRQHGSLTPGTLASYLFISKATVTGILDRLEDHGLVKRERDGSDRRKISVALTPEGEKLARDAVWPLQEQFARKLADLTENQCKEIRCILSLVAEMMETADHFTKEGEEREKNVDF